MTGQLFKVRSLPWQKKSIMAVRRALQQGKCAPSWLVVGSDGVGQYHFACHFAHILLCQASALSQKPCGLCQSCQLFETQNHPDFKLVEATESAQIKIETIREIGERVAQTAKQGGNKVVIIRDAEKMNASAANAFLKTLEEPPAHTYLILVSSRGQAILPTVRSRCQKIVIPSPSFSEALHWLVTQGVDEKTGKVLLSLAQGSPLKALEGKQKPERLNVRYELFKGLDRLSKQMVFPITLAKEWANLNLLWVFDWLELIVMDMVRCSYSVSESRLVNGDKVEQLKTFIQTPQTDKHFWFELLKKIQFAKDACKRTPGLDKLLFLENVLILWWRAHHSPKS